MPCIAPEVRNRLALAYNNVITETPGDLNYAITQLLEAYREGNGDSYWTFNDMIGVLECAKQELYRRIVSPYEDRKIQENGDVYAPLEPNPTANRTVPDPYPPGSPSISGGSLLP